MARIIPGATLGHEILSVDMHTCGEPTRIVFEGYPELSGTLLEQRAQAKQEYDHIRRRLVLEPRGHYDMYGAVLRRDTELTRTGQAHIGVLFLTNDGYSTMCGHATMALGRFLLDATAGIFPRKREIEHDAATRTTVIMLHAPCGLIEVTVPTTDDGTASDPSRPVSFLNVPSFATGIDIDIPIPLELRWPQLRSRDSVTGQFSYGGAFYCMADIADLGFKDLQKPDIPSMNFATKQLKQAITTNPDLRHLFQHPDSPDLGFLYSIIVTATIGEAGANTQGAETGLCFFADQQIDRSPTGSAVAARVALAYAKGTLKQGEAWTYHSLLSRRLQNGGAFTGRLVGDVDRELMYPSVKVRVEGYVYYTGYSSFVVEESDPLGDDGFVFGQDSECR